MKVIVMSGLPGSGKSTIAEGVAKALKIPVFSVDPIESAIIKAGIEKSFETGLAAYVVAATLAAEQLKLGSSVLIDAVNAQEEGKNMWRDLAKAHNVQLIVLECSLADEDLHKNRLKSRVRNLHGFAEIGWDDVAARRKEYTAWKEPTLQLDASNSPQANIQRAIAHIQSK